MGSEFTAAFTNGERTWTDSVNLVKALAECLSGAGLCPKVRKDWLELPNGLTLLPQLSNMVPLEDGGVQTSTTIQIAHSTVIPSPVFEYQHSTGDSLATSVSNGFTQWMNLDLPVLTDALLETPEQSMAIVMPVQKNNGETHYRRVLLGPLSHYQQTPEDAAPSLESEHPPQCPCCFFRSLVDDMQEQLNAEDFIAVRFYAMLNSQGEPEADCRLNGVDWEPGKQALVRYVNSWPDRGFEFRKQYGIIQTVPKPADSGNSA